MVLHRPALASLPMYDWPELRPATDAWWRGVSRHLGIEAELLRGDDYASLWRRPDLLFSQTCGYPLTHQFADHLQIVATPHYAAPGCEGPFYSSFVFAREPRPLEAFRGARAAVNTPESMSGMLALKLVFAPLAAGGRFFGSAVLTGGHLASLAALRKGEADVCAVDAVCVELARRHRPELLDGAVEIARSPLVPGLPYVTAATRPPEEIAALRGALDRALCDPELADARRMLLIAGATPLGAEDYRTILDREHELETAGGIRLFEHKGL